MDAPSQLLKEKTLEKDLFGDAAQRESFENLAASRADNSDSTTDAMTPIWIASIMYCPSIVASLIWDC